MSPRVLCYTHGNCMCFSRTLTVFLVSAFRNSLPCACAYMVGAAYVCLLLPCVIVRHAYTGSPAKPISALNETEQNSHQLRKPGRQAAMIWGQANPWSLYNICCSPINFTPSNSKILELLSFQKKTALNTSVWKCFFTERLVWWSELFETRSRWRFC